MIVCRDVSGNVRVNSPYLCNRAIDTASEACDCVSADACVADDFSGTILLMQKKKTDKASARRKFLTS